MDKLGHITVGAICSLAVVLILNQFANLSLDINKIIILGIITYLFSLLPDIDHPISTITWHFLGIGILGLIASFFFYGQVLLIASIILLALTFACAQFAGHRGPIHTVWAGALFCIPIYFIFNDWRICIIAWAAYYSHLAADGYLFKI